MPLTAISAPYNFVPLSDWVHCPEWADKVSHDIPFRDGLSGYLDLKITAMTPLLVGGEQQKATPTTPGRVTPFQLPDGRYAIPGTALKGMIRNVVEIASFSRMGAVDDGRFGVRDLTPGARPFYGNHMTQTTGPRTYRPTSRAGWLSYDSATNRWLIYPCYFARVEQDHLDRYRGDRWFKDTRSQRMTARQKYEAWTLPLSVRFTPGDEQPHPHSNDNKLVYRKASELGKGTTEGTLVFTGQPSPRKHMEFIFFGIAGDPIVVPEVVFRGFLDIHDQKTEDGHATAWAFWKEKARAPVFFLPATGREGPVGSLGLAMMYKLAYRYSVHDAIRHTNSQHLEHGEDDFATTLFGRIGESPDKCLKGRVTFHHAIAQGNPVTQEMEHTILNGPKATYYPNYVVQAGAQGGRIPEGRGYSTLMDEGCRIRGWKRYPARPAAQAQVQRLTPDQQTNTSVQVVLNPLREGTVFTARIGFHNLRPEELGGLCWALTWGGAQGLRHSLGMGKPFGFGQIAVEVTDTLFQPNRNGMQAPTPEAAIDIFVNYMGAECRKAKAGDWRKSPQIRTLLAMADPANADAVAGGLRHMRLNTEDDNEFKDSKLQRLVLADYPQRAHPETLSDRRAEEERRKEAERKASMTEEDRKIEELEQLFAGAKENNQRKPGDRLGQRFNTIIEEAKGWPRDRKDRLIEILVAINKFLEGDQKKRRARIDTLRDPGPQGAGT